MDSLFKKGTSGYWLTMYVDYMQICECIYLCICLCMRLTVAYWNRWTVYDNKVYHIVVIAENIILVPPRPSDVTTALIWRSGTRRWNLWNLRVPDLQIRAAVTWLTDGCLFINQSNGYPFDIHYWMLFIRKTQTESSCDDCDVFSLTAPHNWLWACDSNKRFLIYTCVVFQYGIYDFQKYIIYIS